MASSPAAFELVEARERHRGGVLVGIGTGGPGLEVGHQLREVPVPLAIELRQSLQRKRSSRLREHDPRVAFDEHPRGRGVRRANRRKPGGLRATPP